MTRMLEHDKEVEPGIPEALPVDERVLWKGGPDFRSLLVGSLRLKTILVYFGVLLLVQLGFSLNRGTPFADAIGTTAGFALLSSVAILLIAGYARLVARSTVFTLTNRRVVMRVGGALPVTINLPYGLIESAELRLQADGSGDISLKPAAGNRVSWLLLWPMVKSLRWLRVQPVLRGLKNAETVAATLGDSLAASLDADSTRRPRVVRDESASADAPAGGRRWSPYPTIPLAAGVSLVVVSLVAVSFSALNNDRDAVPDVPPLVESAELFFEDEADGSVIVRSADTGVVLDVLEPGTNGFLRATLRGLARARTATDAGSEEPFVVGVTETGRSFLIDPVSLRQVDLRAFGRTNSLAFTRFLDLRDETIDAQVPAREIPQPETQIALSKEESLP